LVSLPVFEDVETAAARLDGLAIRTPVLRNEALDSESTCSLFFKPENLQVTGSFKIRGAGNRLTALSSAERGAGVVAFSSGNHAQGVSRAARRLGMSAKIVMPADAPAIKRQRVLDDGAELVEYDRWRESREDISARIAAAEGRVLVPSFDDPYIIAGQGTAGLEFAEDIAAMGQGLDHLVCCVGGGGLIAGISLAFRALSPQTEIWGAEPEAFDDYRRSLKTGRREGNPPDARSICDALLSPSPGEMTFAINRDHLSGVVTVSDAEVAHAMRRAFSELKLVIEPGGGAALAAILAQKHADWQGRRVGIVLTGGNVDPDLFARILAGQSG
jgi:threonine dehydratase